MSLKYVVVPSEALGNLMFVGHAETITKQVRKGNRNERVPEFEVYTLNSSKFGTITVTVPSNNGVKGSFFRKEVTLEGTRVMVALVSGVNQNTGAVTVRTREILHAEKINVKGAAK